MKRSDRAERPERNNLALLHLMMWLSLWLGWPFGQVLLRLTALYFVAVSSATRGASRDYLYHALGRIAMLCDVSRHMLTFATTIRDRVYLISGRFGLFDIRLQGQQHIYSISVQECGAFLLGAHLGSFRVVRVLGQTMPDLRVAVATCEENACNIDAAVAAINPAAASEVIPPGRVDAISQVREALDDNRFVGALTDHTLLRGAGSSVQHTDLLDSPVTFPLGSLHMVTMLKRLVLFMTGPHLGGNRYVVHFGLLVDFTDVRREDRVAAVQVVFGHYVERIEHYCRTAPYNWFNYFDLWQDADTAGVPDHTPADHRTMQIP